MIEKPYDILLFGFFIINVRADLSHPPTSSPKGEKMFEFELNYVAMITMFAAVAINVSLQCWIIERPNPTCREDPETIRKQIVGENAVNTFVAIFLSVTGASLVLLLLIWHHSLKESAAWAATTFVCSTLKEVAYILTRGNR